MITPVRRSTPIKALEILYDLMPLNLYCQYESLASLQRNQEVIKLTWKGESQKCKTYIGHRKYWIDCMQDMQINILNTDNTKLTKWDKYYSVDLRSLNSTDHPQMSQINIFTDGSKTEAHTGAGFVIYKYKIERYSKGGKIKMENTVFQAEVLAIREAVRDYIQIKQADEKNVKIFTDSQAALLALAKTSVTSKLVASTIDMLNILGKTVYTLEICWIKAHTGHIGNERADEIANKTINDNVIYTGVDAPGSYAKSKLMEAIYTKWTEEWIEHPLCRQSKNFLPTPDKNKKNEVLKLGRCRLRRLIEVITGHNNLNYLQSKIYPNDVSELCRFCEEEDETFEHLLNECPCFLIDRRDILFNNPIIKTLDWKPSTLLKFANIPVINEALNFE